MKTYKKLVLVDYNDYIKKNYQQAQAEKPSEMSNLTVSKLHDDVDKPTLLNDQVEQNKHIKLNVSTSNEAENLSEDNFFLKDIEKKKQQLKNKYVQVDDDNDDDEEEVDESEPEEDVYAFAENCHKKNSRKRWLNIKL